MPNLNDVEIMGHLVKDADLRYTNDGDPVVNLTVAVNRTFGDETDFFDVTVWNQGNYKLAEYHANDKKGDLIFVKGKLRQDRWEQNGNKKSKVKIRADKVFNFSQGKKKKSQQSNKQSNNVSEDEDFKTPF